MALYQTLLESTNKVTTKTKDSVKEPRVSNFDLNYDAGAKTITYTARIHSNTSPNNYDVIVQFLSVERNQGLTDEEISQGFQPKPSLGDNDIQVFCNCTNYRFRFDEYNRKNGIGIGPKFPQYHRITDRYPNNPHGLPGICSHIIELVNYLVNQGFVLD